MKRSRTLPVLMVVTVLVLCVGCGDKKMRARIAALDDATLVRIQTNYPPASRAAIVITEELQCRKVPPTRTAETRAQAVPVQTHRPAVVSPTAAAQPVATDTSLRQVSRDSLESQLQRMSTEEVSKLTELLPRIRDLGNDASPEALGRLLAILQFDAHGEIAVHCSLAIAGRSDKVAVKAALKQAFEKAPATSAPWGFNNIIVVSSTGIFGGDTGGSGTGVFPKMRLLYPLAWMHEPDLIRNLLDGSGAWPGASKGKQSCYELIPTIGQGTAALCGKLAWFEYLDEAGNRPVMEQTCPLYPNVGLTPEMWQCVRGRGN